MVRAAAAVLFLAVAALVASAWMRDRPLPEGTPPSAVLERFRAEHPPARALDLAATYQGRAELLEPRLILPAWHRHPRAEAAAVASAIKACPPAPLGVELHDDALRKAYDFAKAKCARAPLAAFFASPPFMHPSGKSYAALAGTPDRDPDPPVPDDARHVIERRDLGLAPRDWVAVARGDRLVLTSNALVVTETSEKEKRLLLYDREAWERETRAAAVSLAPRPPGAFCAAPASPSLCWGRLDPRRPWLDRVTIGAAVVAGLAGALVAFAFARERRRANEDRIHVFRTLTHELRTPAQSLGLDVELLQSTYDALPPDAQEPVLRVSESVARLNRVIHRSARYLQLFDGKGDLVKPERVSSPRELMEEMAAEWPEGVEMREAPGSANDAVVTDPEWLSVALRNLVENAFRHGKPPVSVTWAVDARAFVVTVRDAGTSPRNLLRQAAYHRGAKSQGLGLGLAIVQRIAALLGGKLTHAPSPTTWTLRLPRGEA